MEFSGHTGCVPVMQPRCGSVREKKGLRRLFLCHSSTAALAKLSVNFSGGAGH